MDLLKGEESNLGDAEKEELTLGDAEGEELNPTLDLTKDENNLEVLKEREKTNEIQY